MNKKILLISAILLVLTVALTACKSKTYNPVEGEKDENTDKVVQTVTVTGEDGGVTNVEIFEDEDGEKYITNVDGEKVPLTTDDQGFSDDIGFLVTSKPSAENKPSSSQSSSPSSSKENENNSSSTQPSSNAGENSTADESSSSSESSTGGGIIIDSTTKQDSISWDDIKNPKN
ncbi:MAG: hypothetical protein J1F24_04435 [Oscillospiraceae bacterium]|nr:hypothetical protein [Oscillospiraceae bacterium]